MYALCTFPHRNLIPLAVLLLSAVDAQAASRADVATVGVDCAQVIVSILKEHCVECHDGRRHEGDFSINTRDAIVEAGVIEPGFTFAPQDYEPPLRGSMAFDQSRAKTDFLREPIHYGLHRHFTGSSSVLMFGGGVKRGCLYGETAVERPCLVTKNPISLTDLHATIMHIMGVSPKTGFDVERRPFYVTEDGKGQTLLDLLA